MTSYLPFQRTSSRSVLLSLAASVFFVAQVSAQSLDGFEWPSVSEYEHINTQGKTNWVVDVENDSLLLKRDDGFYTSGNHLWRQSNLREANRLTSYRWTLGQDLYTASDIKIKPSQLSRFDHPYAGWLYFGLSREQQASDGRSYAVGFDLGCLGPCAGGEWTQTHLHQLLNQPLPQAWNTQLKQEWGVVAKLSYAATRLAISNDADLQVRAAARVGNIFADMNSDVLLRWGALNALSTDAASFWQARVGLRAVAYNATIQGGYFRRQNLAVSPKRLVPEAELGYVYQGSQWQFLAAVIRRGNEIAELKNAEGSQNFAKISLGYSF